MVSDTSNILFQSKAGNDYLFSKSIPQVMLMHPVLKYLLEMHRQGKNVREWISTANPEDLEIGGSQKVSMEQLQYYYRYFLYLRENNYFREVERVKMNPNRYSADSVKSYLASTQQIVFEVTDSCNLRCTYCGYGHLYSGYDKREDRMMDFDTARGFLDYMVELVKSPFNKRIQKNLYCSFYGGEPLNNFGLIKQIVDYTKSIDPGSREFKFSMTTNGLCLDKHMDFLAENEFHLLVSLDGNKEHNGYRVLPNGESSFDIIYENVLALKKNHPDYFERFVRFMSVVHDKNSNKEITEFFKTHFDREPQMAEVSAVGIREDRKKDFEKMFKSKYSGLTAEDLVKDTRDDGRILNTPIAKKLASFIRNHSGFVFSSYHTLLFDTQRHCIVQTGTCNPFDKKVFVTVNGKILACERIPHRYSLGHINGSGIHLDFQEIADKYNDFFRKVVKQCNSCSNGDTCSECIFVMDFEDDGFQCPRFKRPADEANEFKNSISLLEETPRFYSRIIKNPSEG